MVIRIPKINWLQAVTVFFAMTPFFLPFPGLGSDLQPYALLLSVLILVCFFGRIPKALGENRQFLLLLVPFVMAATFLALDLFSMGALRGAYNHFSIMVVFLALYILLERFGFPETEIKAIIWIWLLVALVQMFYDREFLAPLISGERLDTRRRGVMALCSEPSFFGISCFYFLHLVNRFRKHRWFYIVLVSAMAVLLAQSMQGLLFLAVFFAGQVVESINSKRGWYLLIGLVIGTVVGYFLLLQIAPDSRLVDLLESIFDQGLQGAVDDDTSATVRLNAIINAISEALEGYLIPQGFGRRIGSGFGGIIVELGIFGLLEAVIIAHAMCLHFRKSYARVIYFILVFVILFSNTQIGNPQLLLVMASNLYFHNQEKYHEQEIPSAGERPCGR